VNKILIRWPDRALSPNGRVHYMVRHKAVRNYRETARYLGLGQKRLRNPLCAIVPLVATRRRRDLDNVLASLKSALDGLTDAGWWDDDSEIDSFQLIPQVFSTKWDANRVLIVASDRDEASGMAQALELFRGGVVAGNPHAALNALGVSI
jgi:crossover junction endodeoxyribonuclease RusA